MLANIEAIYIYVRSDLLNTYRQTYASALQIILRF
jgi:hypothetical protein